MKARQYRGLGTGLALGLLCAPVIALAQAEDVYDLSIEQLMQVPVYTASRLSQKISDAPNAMTVIDRNMIVASGFRTIPDLFKLVPGMYVSYYKGAQAIVSYHGATDTLSRRMQVMIDGVSVYLPPVNSVEWAGLPVTVDDIQRIEVIRGPAAASYGANSTQGVINIITKDASESDAGSVSYTHGNKGINDVTAHVARRGDVFDYRMSLASATDDGYDGLTQSPNGLPPNTALYNNSNDSNRARMVNFRGNYHPNPRDSVKLQFGYNHDVQGVGFNDKTPTPLNPASTNANPFHDLRVNSGLASAEWKHQLENSSELGLSYSHQRQSMSEAFPVYVAGIYFPGPVTQSLVTSRDQLGIQHTLSVFEGNRLVYGANYQRNSVDGQSLMSLVPGFTDVHSSFATENIQFFADDEWNATPHLLLNAGAMFEREDFGHRNLSPRVSANFHITPTQTVRAGISVAYRTPSLIERNFPQVLPGAMYVPSPVAVAPHLSPEKMVSHEIGYIGEFPAWHALLDLRLFKDHLGKGIAVNKIAGIATFENSLDIDYRGVEATLKKSWEQGGELTLNYAHLVMSSNAPQLAAAGNAFMGSPLAWSNDMFAISMPRDSANLLYSLKFGGDYAFSTSYYFQSDYMPVGRGAVDYQPAQHRADARIAKRLRISGGEEGEAAFVVQNLFDTGYTDYVANNLFNRRAYVTLSFKW